MNILVHAEEKKVFCRHFRANVNKYKYINKDSNVTAYLESSSFKSRLYFGTLNYKIILTLIISSLKRN